MRKRLIAMILAVAALHGHAQNVAGNFLPRANDEVKRQQVAYVAVNEGAEYTVWDFTQLDCSGREYTACYAEEDAYEGLIVGTEFNTRHYYLASTDSLLLCGYENNLTKVEYDRPELLLHLPLTYGERHETLFHGTASYCERLFLRLSSTHFSEQLAYTGTNGAASAATPCFNGNIAAMAWKAGTETAYRNFQFSYNAKGWMTAATYSGTGSYSVQYQYDPMGNITSLQRYGLQDNSQYGLIDNLSYTYNGNQLVTVTDGSSGPNYSGAFHFSDGADEDVEYEYDQNGNLTKDLNKNIRQIDYNLLNLPSEMNLMINYAYYFISHVYDATGRLIKTTYPIGINVGPGVVGPLGKGGDVELQGGGLVGPVVPPHIYDDGRKDYCGNIIYENSSVKQILFDGGYITFSSGAPVYHYYLQDHLGNNRVVVKQDGTIEQVNHYYPFGGLFGESTNGDVQRFKYNGKELERMHGLDWYDYGARHLDAALGRWSTIDPMAEKYYNLSPYNYCGNNPINAIDMNGLKPDSISAALMSLLAYGYNKEAYQELTEHKWSFVSHYESESGFKYNVYKKEKGDGSFEYTLAYAGTDIDSGLEEFAKDALNDIGNFFGNITPQYLEAAITALGISGEELTFVGHSLGGGLAALSSKLTGKDAITFNPASLSGEVNAVASVVSLFRGGHITQYRSFGNGFFGGLLGDPINTVQNQTGRYSQGTIIPVFVGNSFSHSIKDIIAAFHRNAKLR